MPNGGGNIIYNHSVRFVSTRGTTGLGMIYYVFNEN